MFVLTFAAKRLSNRKNCLHDAFFKIAIGPFSAWHHQIRGLVHCIQFVRDKPLCASPTKIRDELPRETRTEQVTGHAHNSARIEHRVDAAFAVIAHN